MDVYIFGAGASAAEGAPATQEFFGRAWTLLGPQFDLQIQAVWHFLERVFFTDLNGPGAFDQIPAVDEVISLVDWCLQASQGLGHRYDPPALREIRRNVEHLLCATLDAALNQGERGEGGPHARFARALALAAGRCPVRQVALISLNYDTLLDEALARAGLAPAYGLHADGPGAGPLLAKLHGSLNWARCTACGQIAVSSPTCSRCGNGRLHGLIISPTWLKSYEGAHLQRIWDRALACIQQAERIVFVGYSVPPADVAVYQLIRRGMLLRPDDRMPAIEVINHTDPGWTEAERALHEGSVRSRFHRLFGAEVHFDFDGFYGQI
jgi:hypothetical protein